MKNAKLVPLKYRADPEMVKFASELLRDVKKGEVRACGIVKVQPGGVVSTGWCSADDYSRGYYHSLTSGAAVLSARLALCED